MHVPVLAEELVEWLAVGPDSICIDATYGRGGHSAMILRRLGPGGRLLAFDRDPEAARDAAVRFAGEPRFEFVNAAFSALGSEVEARGLRGRVGALAFDLGASSPQFDEAGRGFSFEREGPLDMRMDPRSGRSAADWINSAPEKEIADVIYHYGEERYSRRIARAIVARRRAGPIATTSELATAVVRAVPRRERRIHPATRTFQAIRIFINDELDELRAALSAAPGILAPAGRLAVISFHSLEDRIVKNFIRDAARADPPRLRVIARLVRPQAPEAARNPRARSARMRVAERPA